MLQDTSGKAYLSSIDGVRMEVVNPAAMDNVSAQPNLFIYQARESRLFGLVNRQVVPSPTRNILTRILPNPNCKSGTLPPARCWLALASSPPSTCPASTTRRSTTSTLSLAQILNMKVRSEKNTLLKEI